MNPIKIGFQAKGLVLVMCLLMLTIMTLIAITSIRSASIGEKVFTNQKSISLAFQAADTVLQSGEQWLDAKTNEPTTCNTSACDVFEAGATPDLSNASANWWSDNSESYQNTLTSVAEQPSYVLEAVYFKPDDLSPSTWATGQGLHYYAVTGRGIGGTSKTEVILQSTYTTRYN